MTNDRGKLKDGQEPRKHGDGACPGIVKVQPLDSSSIADLTEQGIEGATGNILPAECGGLSEWAGGQYYQRAL